MGISAMNRGVFLRYGHPSLNLSTPRRKAWGLPSTRA
jgi:hypothetical protein